MSRDDTLDLALWALEELGEGGDSTQTQYAFNAINAFTPADENSEATASPPRVEESPVAPDPGARCGRHRRLLTFAEQLFGACSWCVWEDRQGGGGP